MQHDKRKRTIKPSDMNPNAASSPITAQAITNADKIVKKMDSLDGGRGYSCDELHIMGKDNLPQGEIYVELTNNTGDTLQVPFGTPLMVSDEAVFLTQLIDAIPANERWDHDLPNLIDNTGANAPYYQMLGKRFLRHPVIVNYIEVITDDDTQRSETPRLVWAPWNSAEDSNKLKRRYQGIYTEVNEIQLLKDAVVFGEFAGILYNIFDGNTVQFNIGVCAVDSPNWTPLDYRSY